MFLDLLAMEMNINRFCREAAWLNRNWHQGWVKPMLRGIVPRQEEGVKPLISPSEWAKADGC